MNLVGVRSITWLIYLLLLLHHPQAQSAGPAAAPPGVEGLRGCPLTRTPRTPWLTGAGALVRAQG